MTKVNLHSGKYLEASYNPQTRLGEFYWKKTTEDMTEAEYRMIMSDILDKFMENLKTKNWSGANWLLDNRQFLFTMPPKLQEWQAKKIFEPLVESGAKKVAVIMSEDWVTQFAIEQTFDEDGETKMLTQYFSDLDQANEWLQE